MIRALLRGAAALLLALVCSGGVASAHPLGNFTVNHLTRLRVSGSTLHVRYVLDMAEIPTFALQRSLDSHGAPPPSVLEGWAYQHAAEIAPQLAIAIDGKNVALTPGRTSVRLRPGAGGLPILYATAEYTGTVPAGARRISFADNTEPGRLGWKDVVVAREQEPTSELRRYPSALVGSPRDRTTLAGTLEPDGFILIDQGGRPQIDQPAAVAGFARSNALSDVLARGARDPRIVLGALLLAFVLGALHAFEPGHGKTLLAVSLVGARATPSQAVILASALTIAHTIGVFALGLATVVAARYIVPETVYPWITLISGVLVALLGGRALAREIARRRSNASAGVHAHPHPHPHAHAHGDEHEAHEHHNLNDEAHARSHVIPGSAPVSFRTAVLAASTGNLAPCPAALVVLLAALQFHAIGYGLVLIVVFGLGLAAVLVGLGFAIVRAGGWLARRPALERLTRYAPLGSASVITFLGAIMIARGFAAQGVAMSPVLVASLVLLAIAGYVFAVPSLQRLVHTHA